MSRCNEISVLNVCGGTIALTLTITTSSETFTCPSTEPIIVTFTVTNTGNLDVQGKIKVYSHQLGNIVVSQGWLAAGASESAVLPYTITVCDCRLGQALISGQARLVINKCQVLVSQCVGVELTRIVLVP